MICPLCEAGCGLVAEVEGERVLAIRGNADDVASRGHICPKGVALKDLHEDPDRLRRPMIREGEQWRIVSWHDALDQVAARLHDIQSRHGKDSVAVYGGNPTAHNFGIFTHYSDFLGQLGTRNIYSAASLDILPVQLVAFLLYGHQFLLPVADIDRTQHLLVIGANPMVSNGSMMTVPDFPARLKALKGRGGRMAVIDPRRTETAKVADAHHFIRPGSDAFLLLAMIGVLFAEGRVDLGKAAAYVDGLDEVRALCARVPVKLAAQRTGLEAETILTLAREFADAPSAACYGRIGVSVQRYGSVCQWAIQLLNILTGNFDREGGVMFAEHVAPARPSLDDAGAIGRWHSRVSGYPEFGGLMPVAALAEEILTEGEGRIRALVSLAGNPIRSAPNSGKMARALKSLEYIVTIDPYLNETGQYADIALPPVSQLQRSHYPMFTARFGTRNTMRYSPALLQTGADEMQDWEILAGLACRIARLNGSPEPDIQTPETCLEEIISGSAHPDITLRQLMDKPEGIDFGPLRSVMPGRLLTPEKRINLASKDVMVDVDTLLANAINDGESFLLFGRRNVRSNNSWMHNLPRLMARRPDHHLLVHPRDAEARGVKDGMAVRLSTESGSLVVEARLSEEVMPGTLCLPHGWDHIDAANLSIASTLPGANFNLLVDDRFVDRPSAGSAFNAIPCHLEII